MNFTWEKLWRSAGIQAVLFLIVAYVIQGNRPDIGASAGSLVSFYDGDSTRILIATPILGLAVLNLVWFAAALTSTLRDAGLGGWGAAATAASAGLAAAIFASAAVSAALAHTIAGSGNVALTSGLNDLTSVATVLMWFPAAMLVMAGSFGLWRAGLISNTAFGVGVTAVVLVLAGGTTLASDGFWAPDGAYAQLVAPAVMLGWVAVVSSYLVRLSASMVRAPERAVVAAR
jgi:hypothetical protein